MSEQTPAMFFGKSVELGGITQMDLLVILFSDDDQKYPLDVNATSSLSCEDS